MRRHSHPPVPSDAPVPDVERIRQRVEQLQPAAGGAAAAAVFAELHRVLDDLHIQRELLDSTRRRLQVEREQLAELFRLAPDGYLVTDPYGVIQEANRAACTLLGEPEGGLAGEALAAYLTPARRPQLERRLAGLRRGEEGAAWEMRLSPRGGAYVDAELAAGPVHEGDSLIGVRWMLRDLTAIRREETAARRLWEEQAARAHAQAAERRNAFLAEAGEMLAASLDYEGTLASVARLAVPRIADSCIAYVLEDDGRVRRLGVAHADRAREQALRALLERRPFDTRSLVRPVARVLRTGEAELIPEITGRDGDAPFGVDEAEWNEADLAPRSLLVVPLRVRDRILGALSLGWSETGRYTPDDLWLARKLAERAALALENARLHREARRASEAKSAFLAAMSHEFRTPLTAIVAFADLLVAGIPEPISGAPLKQAERILDASRHLAELIEQVLTFSRLDSERERAQAEPVDLGALARDTAALVQPLAEQKGLRMTVDVPAAGPVVTTDANKVRQVLFNLLGNAVKFTERGEVRLAIHPAAGGVTLEVHDTGEGIAPADLHRIWEPFWQAARPETGRPPGTGLGLGIVRQLVRVLGGEIHARSEPGRGTAFVVRLSAAPADGQGAA
ncbi:ATP-binding protein [Longimicrobium sp.]|uniref:PAS domain-containing sensor histidine kinase n=1 Tax=Longimicrobium sp. TaxID=2029185 RepID=UPI003B3B1812